MKTIKFLLAAVIVLNVALAVAYFFYVKPARIAYVDNIALFNGFRFKKERQAEYEQQKTVYQSKLDTLRINHLSIEEARQKNPGDKELEKRSAYSLAYYKEADYVFAARLDSMDNRFNSEVWLKINQYIEMFGQEHRYDMVIGASGTGSLMYGSKPYDITEDVLEYINKKYEGD